MLKTILSLYLVLAVIISQTFATYIFSKTRTSYRKAFSALVLCISIYLFGYLMIINNNNLQELIFWNKIQYLGLPFISVLWLIVALLYTKTVSTLSKRLVILLFLVPVITFFIRLTNDWHHLFYTCYGVKELSGYYYLYRERGWWYYVNISYTTLCLLLTIIICYLGYLKDKACYIKPHFLVFLLASLIPFIGIVVLLFTYQEWNIDYAALILPVSLMIIIYGILKYDFLEIRTLARDTIFENNLDGMVILGSGQWIIDYNKAAEKFFTALNISLDHYPIQHVLSRKPELLDIFASTDTRDFSLIMDGERRFFKIDTVPLGDSYDGNSRMLKTIRDVTEERKIRRELELLATTDFLSGLYNRAEFMNLAQKEFARAQRHNGELSLLMMDLDCFKTINDTFGHLAGDEVIREMGRIIRAVFRENGIAGRIGGDEFAVILKNTPLQEAKKMALQFQQTVAAKKVIYEKQEITLTVSVGVAAVGGAPDDSSNIEDMLKKADDALYKAKAEGRNCVATLESGGGNS